MPNIDCIHFDDARVCVCVCVYTSLTLTLDFDSSSVYKIIGKIVILRIDSKWNDSSTDLNFTN